MKCWNCGNEVSGGRFCGSCGADQEQNPQGAPSGGGRSGNEIILTVFAALCGVVYGAQAVRGLWDRHRGAGSRILQVGGISIRTEAIRRPAGSS